MCLASSCSLLVVIRCLCRLVLAGQRAHGCLIKALAKWHVRRSSNLWTLWKHLHLTNQLKPRAQKRQHDSPERNSVSRKCNRMQTSRMSSFFFFCGQAAGNDGLHEVTTFQVDQRVRECAELTGDSMLLAKLISGDIVVVALEVKYHSKCLLPFTTVPGKVRSRSR